MVELRGLWQRARMDRDLGRFTALIGVILVALVYPLLSRLPPDAVVQVYRRAR